MAPQRTEKLGGQEKQGGVRKIIEPSRQLMATLQVNRAGLGKSREARKVDFEDPGILRFSFSCLSHCSFKGDGPRLSTSWQVPECRHLRYRGSEALGF